jgi:plastocyanin
LKRGLATLGVLLVLSAGLLFWSTFSGGSLGGYVITDGNAAANLVAIAFVIICLPLGSGLAFYGLSYGKNLAAGERAQTIYPSGSSSTSKAALGLAVIAVLIGAGIYVSMSSTIGTQSNEISSLTAELSSLAARPSGASINATPGTIAFRIDWSNTDPTGQDRFNPMVITAVQGSIVQILFEHNDTDTHTFTLYSSSTPYGFQINSTGTGMHNFLNNQSFSSGCPNGSYSQSSTGLSANGVSTVYCVSGSSLLSTSFLSQHAAANFRIAVNPTPSIPLGTTKNPSVILLPVDNSVHIIAFNSSASPALSMVYGVGAFQANTPGVYEFFCDYHVSNGMFGYLVVLPNAYCNTDPGACGIKTSS